MGDERRSEEFFKGVDDAVEELEDKERFHFASGREEEEDVAVDEVEDEGGRVGVGEEERIRARRGMR